MLRLAAASIIVAFTVVVAAATLQEIASPAGPGAAQPFLGTDEKGRLLMSWLEPTVGGRVALRFARFDGNWSKPGTIVEGSNLFVNWADFPSIAADPSGVLIAHWLQKSGASTYAYDVRFALSRDGGRSWSKPMLLNRDGKLVEHGFASIAPRRQGGFDVVWLDGRQMPENSEEGEMSLRFASIGANGTIAREVVLDRRTCECCSTAMAGTSEGAVIAYRDRMENELRDISIVRVSGGKVTKPTPLHDDGWKIAGCPVNGPQIDARGNDVAVAWFTGANEQARVNVAFSQNAGAVFGRPIRVDAGSPMGRVEVLLLPNSDALIVWMEGLGNAAQVSARRVSRDGQLGPVVKLASSSAARSSGFPRAALSGAKAFFAWTETAVPKRIRVAVADATKF